MSKQKGNLDIHVNEASMVDDSENGEDQEGDNQASNQYETSCSGHPIC